ncbi:DUF58 domain-containing protein [Persephonella sp. IF05-L8]|uniref:DUF58 domain-containing protein n=1 Tax=Persephonella sp. IF05-L8 TaxID=1158338 RepID=UPI0004976BD5
MIEKSKIISLKAQHKVLSSLEGIHKAIIFGEEDDLKNIREYTYGDNVKRINWIITAKERKPYVVEREELKSQNIIIVLLLDQEMLFKNKLDKVSEIFAILGYSALYHKDKLHTYIFTDKIEKYFPHKNHPQHITNILDFIYSLDIKHKKIDTENIYRLINRHKRSLVILIGDFVYPMNILNIASKHKLSVICVRDKEEENPSGYTGFQLKSFDEKRKIPLLVSPMVKIYKRNLEKLDENLRHQIVLKRIPFQKIFTDEDPFIKLKLMFS